MKRTLPLLLLLLLFASTGDDTPPPPPIDEQQFCEEWLHFSGGSVAVYTSDSLELREP